MYCMKVIVFDYCKNVLPKVLSRLITTPNVMKISMVVRSNNIFSVTNHTTLHGPLLLYNL